MAILGLGMISIKDHIKLTKHEHLLFDKATGERRFLSKDDCQACNNDRLRREEDRTRELQNIHTTISEIKKDQANMPQRIAEHLKTMGLLKD